LIESSERVTETSGCNLTLQIPLTKAVDPQNRITTLHKWSDDFVILPQYYTPSNNSIIAAPPSYSDYEKIK
jgi:hypothetical protein